MPLRCPLCSAPQSAAALPGHLRWELRVPLLRCLLCPQAFADEPGALKHSADQHPETPDGDAKLLRCPPEPAGEARLEALLGLANSGGSLEDRLCRCGRCQVACGQSLGTGSRSEVEEEREEPAGAASGPEVGAPGEDVIEQVLRGSNVSGFASAETFEDSSLVRDDLSESFAFEDSVVGDEPEGEDVKPSLLEVSSFEEAKVACLQCGKQLRRNNFALHVRRDHMPKERYKCLLCATEAGTKGELSRHQRSEHQTKLVGSGAEATFEKSVPEGDLKDWIRKCFGETVSSAGYKRMRCIPCGKAVQSQAVKPHIARVHLRKVMYRCRVCPYALRSTDPGDVNRHVRLRHGLAPGPDAVDAAGLRQFAPVVKAMIPEYFGL